MKSWRSLGVWCAGWVVLVGLFLVSGVEAGWKGTLQYARSKPYQIHHLKLVLRIWPEQKRLEGRAIFTMSARGESLKSISLDAVALDIHDVEVDGKRAKWRCHRNKLLITPGRALVEGRRVRVVVGYRAKPRSGLYFVLPDKAHPHRPVTVFSQGESETNRHWFPSYDFPNMRFTTETEVTVPSAYQVISNGRRLSRKVKGRWVTVHHRMSHPHVNYLVSLVIGKFVMVEQVWDGIPIRSYVFASDREKAKRSFQNTSDMMSFFSKMTGFRYPYAKYSQVTVPHFVAGGMENITATTLTRQTLHDRRAHLNRRSDHLVAHELAHQWFGDLMTCRDWRHIWLNESFATYFDLLYTEYKWGKDAFDVSRRNYLGGYFGEARWRYKRAIVPRRYERPGSMFDAHSYPKGAGVLHMIRTRLGDRLWWRAVRHYVKKHAHQNVETRDFRKALEEVSGWDWESFFAQWVYRGGHPQVWMSWSYDEKHQVLKITLKQTQKGHVFAFDVPLVVRGAKGSKRMKISVHGRKQELFLSFGERPLLVELDPRGDLLMELRSEKGLEEWLLQLREGSAIHSKGRAVGGLVKFGHREKVSVALGKVLLDRRLYWGLRRKAAWALGQIGTKAACRELMGAHGLKAARVRSQVIQSLGGCAESAPLEVLVGHLRGDESYEVRRAAVASIARLRHARTFGLLLEALKQDSDLGQIQQEALRGMVFLATKRAFPSLFRMVGSEHKPAARMAAMSGLSRLARLFEDKVMRRRVARVLVPHLRDGFFRVQLAAIRALGVLGERSAIHDLKKVRASLPRGQVMRAVKEAIKKIHQGQSRSTEVVRLRKELEALKKRQNLLRSQVRQLRDSYFGKH